MHSFIRAALCAGAATFALTSAPAPAAFFTYTFTFSGSGKQSGYDSTTTYFEQDLKGATLQFGFNVEDGAMPQSLWYGERTDVDFTTSAPKLSFAFTPDPLQSVYVAEGFGTACLANGVTALPVATSDFVQGCGSTTFTASSNRQTDSFSGDLVRASVTRADAGSNFFSIVGYVPEPTTWALMLAGFGMVGYALRRRPRVAYAT